MAAFLRKYGEQTTIRGIPLLTAGDPESFYTGALADTGTSDSRVSKDGGAMVDTNTLPSESPAGSGLYTITLNTAEMEAASVVVRLQDVAGSAWADQMVVIETYGHASAAHAFDFDTAIQDVNVTQISSDSTAADNLESMYDGTGYTDDTAPSSRAQVSTLGGSSGALNFEAAEDNTGGAIKGATFAGVQTSGTYTDTDSDDGVYHNITQSANEIDIVYGFDVGGARNAVDIAFIGYLNGNADDINIQAYDFTGTAWETRSVLPGKGGTGDVTATIPLLSKHTGTGADLGKVYIRFNKTGMSASGDLFVDELLVAAVITSQSIGYADGAVWVDTVNGVAGTEAFVNGIADNPVSNWVDAQDISDTLGITRFRIVNGSTITLDENTDNHTLIGQSWALALASQSIVGIYVQGAQVSGIGTGTGTYQVFNECLMNATTHIKGTHMNTCGIADTQTVGEAGDYFFDRCHSAVAGTATWTFEFGDAIGDTNLNVRNYSGGIQLESMGDTGTDTASIEGQGNIIEGSCTGGTVAVRGVFTTSAISNLTLSDDARVDMQHIVDSVLDEEISSSAHGVNGTLGAAFRDLNLLIGSVVVNYDTPPILRVTQVIPGGFIDNSLNNCLCVWRTIDADIGGTVAGHARISDSASAAGDIFLTLDADTLIGNVPVADMGVIVYAPTITPAEVEDAVWDAARADHITADTFGEHTNADVIEWLGTAVTLSSSLPDVNVARMDDSTVTQNAVALNAIGSSELADSAAVEIADKVWDTAMSSHNTVDTFGRQVRNTNISRTMLIDGFSGGDTISLGGGEPADDDDAYNGMIIMWRDPAAYQDFGYAEITDYVGGTTQDCTVTNILGRTPTVSDEVIIYPAKIAPNVTDISDSVWDEALSGHMTIGSAGRFLSGLTLHQTTISGSPASTTSFTMVDGPVGADYYEGAICLNTDTSTMNNVGISIIDTYSSFFVTLKAAPIGRALAPGDQIIILQTGSGGIPGSVGTLDADKIADHVLRRSWENAADSGDGDTKSFRSLLGAVAKLVNKVTRAGTTLTVYEEDDSTTLGEQTLTLNADAIPVVETDTN